MAFVTMSELVTPKGLVRPEGFTTLITFEMAILIMSMYMIFKSRFSGKSGTTHIAFETMGGKMIIHVGPKMRFLRKVFVTNRALERAFIGMSPFMY